MSGLHVQNKRHEMKKACRSADTMKKRMSFPDDTCLDSHRRRASRDRAERRLSFEDLGRGVHRDALSARCGGWHRTVQQMARFQIFHKERLPKPSLVATLACSEAALP